MKILALVGPSSSGKSLTLKYLIEIFGQKLQSANPGTPVFYPATSGRCTRYVDGARWGAFLTRLRQEEQQMHKTIQDAFTMFDWNGKKIGIFTIGDARRYLEEKFKTLETCDIIVCPTHEKCNMLKFLFGKCSVDLWFVKKEKIDSTWQTQIPQNKSIASDLFQRVEALTHL